MKTARKIAHTTIVTTATLVLLAVTACSNSSGLVIEDPDTTTVSTPQSTSSSVSTTVSPLPTTAPGTTTSSTPTATSMTDSTGVVISTKASTSSPPISAEEATDRAAAEKTWLDYSAATDNLWEKPKGTWAAVYERYTVEPLKTGALKRLEESVAAGKGNWGESVHHPYWMVAIDGKPLADLMDCIDSRNTGTMNAKTGKKLTRGVEHDNTHITLSRQKDGGWKVMNVTYLPNLACPGAPTANEEMASMEAAATSSVSTEATR